MTKDIKHLLQKYHIPYQPPSNTDELLATAQTVLARLAFEAQASLDIAIDPLRVNLETTEAEVAIRHAARADTLIHGLQSLAENLTRNIAILKLQQEAAALSIQTGGAPQ